MRILIVALGKSKAGPERALYDHYFKRLPWNVTLKELEDRKPSGTREQRKRREAELLLEASKAYDIRIALDERGKSLNSLEFASFLKQAQDRGEASVAFLIGGADGLDDNVFAHCRLRLNLGAMTWPHMLVRGLLAEQLYRAHTILTGHPYHRE